MGTGYGLLTICQCLSEIIFTLFIGLLNPVYTQHGYINQIIFFSVVSGVMMLVTLLFGYMARNQLKHYFCGAACKKQELKEEEKLWDQN